ncbi:hypothetical protein GCM10023169_03290 [Georgenia halophila]|uniref:HNH endonuclease n=2 Tax=Georgenia halophila TaxID=620889 RepID=A0ABP8KUH3_9MICO
MASVLATDSDGLGRVRWRLAEPATPDAWDYKPLVQVTRSDFPICPICRWEGDLTDEHVPPARLGGAVLTRTCAACNNAFGSYEDTLLKRSEQRYTMAVRGPGISNERRISDVIVRRDDAGREMLTTWNGFWPDWFTPVFTDTGYEYRLEQPCACWAYAAALKNAYLAACALAPDVVLKPGQWPVADSLRQQLLNWRDSDEHLTLAAHFNRIQVRYEEPRLDKPAVTLCQATHRQTGERRQVIWMGWHLVVEWPIDRARISLTDE